MVKKTAWLVGALFLLMTVAVVIPAEAAVTSVEIRVDGLACPFCAYGLEKKVKKHVKVKDYNVDFEKGLVHVGFKQEEKFTIREFKKAVKEAGFTYRKMWATVRGNPVITERPEGQSILLVKDGSKNLTVKLKSTGDTYPKLLKQVKAGSFKKGIQVYGRVIKSAESKKSDSDFSLRLERFTSIKNKVKEKKGSKKKEKGEDWF